VVFDSNFFKRKPAQFMIENAARKRFSALAKQIWRCAAKDQETGGRFGSIDQNPQHREKIRLSLDLIDDHDSLKPFKGKHRISESGHVFGVFQIEVGRWTLCFSNEQTGQCCFPDLARPNNSNGRVPPEEPLNGFDFLLTFYYHGKGLP
jgi:hypothetical protein